MIATVLLFSMPYARSFYTPSSGIIIRNPQRHDIHAMARIEEESFGDPWSAEILQETIECFYETSFCAVAGGKVISFVICGIEYTGSEVYGHICNIATDPRYRDLGIGKDLILHAETAAIAREAKAMQLEVRQSNVLAQQFYLKLSYQPVCVFDSYYANGEDALFMMKWF
ncbi:MAG: ribosomal protein S18-alanine N-acetyltransferase [Methanomicrobiales archaeon]|jgi:ribosomal-protein-alanine N-acetyltransferase|nr:ribosomal protein S18-alanine N-acetyltransferase [Methanomicrobiales archaeon]